MATTKVAVFSRNATSRGESPLYYVSRAEADAMTASGSASNVSPKRGKLTHIQLTHLSRSERPSPASLTESDVLANAGLGSTSRQRQAQAKVAAWPTVGDTKAVRVRPIIPSVDRQPMRVAVDRDTEAYKLHVARCAAQGLPAAPREQWEKVTRSLSDIQGIPNLKAGARCSQPAE